MVSLELEARLDNLLATAQEETADMFAPIPEKEECPICLLPLPLLSCIQVLLWKKHMSRLCIQTYGN